MSRQQMFAPPRQTNGHAVAALILGIVSFMVGVWSLVPILGIGAALFAFLPAVLAVAFGHSGLRNSKPSGVGAQSSTWGLLLGYATLVIILLTTFWWFAAMGSSN